ILANGREFAEARDELRHNKAGGLEGWITHHGWSKTTAYRYIQAWEEFGNLPTVGRLAIDAKALYLLSAPSTPAPAREERLARAFAGEPIARAAAREIVNNHRDEREPPPPSHPHSDSLVAWLGALQSKTLVIRIEQGGIKALLAEPDKWNRSRVRDF